MFKKFLIFYMYFDLIFLYDTGFHEGMADIVTLSFQTPEHLYKLGLVDSVPAPDDTGTIDLFTLFLIINKAN